MTNSSGTATNFGTATAINFTNGVASVSSGSNGVMKLYKVETASITVSIGSINNGSGLSVTVSEGPAASLSLAAATTTPTAGAADNLTITAQDAYGNTATTYTGSHSLTFGGANTIGSFAPTVTSSAGTATNFGTATAISFTSGVASVSGANNGVMTLYKAETAKVTVSDGSISNGTGLSVTVSPGPAASLSLAAATTTPTAGAADNLTITAKDAYGNTATTYTGSHSLTFGGANTIGSFAPTVTSSAGTATNFGTETTISFTSGVASVSSGSNGVMKLYKVEAASITVSDGTINNGSGLSVSVGSAAAASFSLAAASTTPVAGVADNLTITALDAYGNTATTYTGSHTLTFGGAATIGTNHPKVTNSSGTATNFGTGTAISFASGVASVSGASNGVMTLYKAEAASITVSEGTINNGSGLSVTVSEGPAASLSLAAATTTPVAGAADNLTITAQDAYGNTATTYTGSHSLTFGGASTIGSFTPTVTSSAGTATNFGTATAISFTSGVASVSGANNGVMTLYKVETAKITVSDGSINNGTGLSVTVGEGPAASLSMAAATTTPVAGAADNLTITAKDAFGNTATTYTGSHSLTFGGAATIGSFTPTVTSSAGTATNFGTETAISFTKGVASVSSGNNGVMKLYKVEAASITVSDGSINNGTGLSVTVGSAAVASLSLTAASTTPTAGAADNLTITASDTYGNGYTGSQNLTFGGAATIGTYHPTVTNSSGTATNFGTATAISFTNGSASVSGGSNGVMTLYKVETAKITVSDGSINNGTGLSVTVGVASAASLSLAAGTTTPVAAAADNLTITAKDAYGNTATTYTGSHSLTFGGANNGPNGNPPTVTSSSGTATNFGTATAISFTNGVASVSSGNNGAMKLYKVEAASITVSDGTINNGAGLAVTVKAGAAAQLAWTHVVVSSGTLSSPCLFTCTVTALGNSGTFTASVSVTDSSGNTVTNLGTGHTVSVTNVGGSISGGALTISSTEAAESTTQFTFTAQNGSWTSDSLTAQTSGGTSYTSATATVTQN